MKLIIRFNHRFENQFDSILRASISRFNEESFGIVSIVSGDRS